MLPVDAAHGLAGLPRRRREPPTSPTPNVKEAITDLRRLGPSIRLSQAIETTFLEGAELTQAKCLHWLGILKQFFGAQPASLSASVPLRSLPPISFLNLLIDWIDSYAKTKDRRKKGLRWRWHTLRGFVNRRRLLQPRVSKYGRPQRGGLLGEISVLAKSIAAHFSRPPFDNRLLLLWGDYWRFQYLKHSRAEIRSSNAKDAMEQGEKAAKVFDVLRRYAHCGKVIPSDYSTLAPYVSKRFHVPFFIQTLHNARERREQAESNALGAAADVYVQYLRMSNMIDRHQEYVRGATTWFVELGEPHIPPEPNIRPQFDAIRWRFCSSPAGNLRRRPKKRLKRVLDSKAT